MRNADLRAKHSIGGALIKSCLLNSANLTQLQIIGRMTRMTIVTYAFMILW